MWQRVVILKVARLSSIQLRRDMLEPGDDYIRKTADFIRNNEQRLADAGVGRRRKATSLPPGSVYNPLSWSWFGVADATVPRNPVVLSLDTHHLFYLLMRLEALGLNVGCLDVHLHNLSRPLSYVHLGNQSDKSETLSIAESFRSSMTVMSKLSLGGAWWGRSEPLKIDTELRYIFSSFTKLPALSVHAPGPKGIEELASDPPDGNAIPLYALKNLQSFECLDIDPRAFLGWDRLAESLRSLTIRRSGVDNPMCIIVDAVLEDQARREGDRDRTYMRRFGSRSSFAFDDAYLPETVQEESEDSDTGLGPNSSARSAGKLPPLKWAFLKHLSLAENALPSLPSDLFQYLTSLTNLDLSSNLLVSIPSGLSSLYNLVHLNLSDNMIDSVLGIYMKLGSVLTINLSRNRLDSLCGLERLMALERIDLRHNQLEESAEVGRLAVLPNISEVWIEDNPFMNGEENPRAKCFDHFWKEGKTINLDGVLPTFYERRLFTTLPSEQMTSSRPASAPYSPPLIATDKVYQAPNSPLGVAGPSSSPGVPSSPSPALQSSSAQKRNRRKKKRIVDLDEGENASQDGASSRSPSRVASLGPRAASKSPARLERHGPARASNLAPFAPTPIVAASTGIRSKAVETLSRHARHSRFLSELAPSPIAELPSSPQSAGLVGADDSDRPTRRSNKRRERQAASVYEPPRSPDPASHTISASNSDAEAFRARMEALRSEVGDNWLHVFSQSQLGATSPKSSGPVANGHLKV